MSKEFNPNRDFEIIHSYSRAKALEDGLLVDVTETAKEAGFNFPVALTAAAYGAYVAVPEEVSCQDKAGRLRDILWMLFLAIKQSEADRNDLRFGLLVRNSDDAPHERVTLKAICGPGDQLEPVMTVMMPGED